MSNYEIPNELRDFAERSVEQARKAFEGFVTVAQKAAGTIDGAAQHAQAEVKNVNAQIFGYAEQNVASALDFAGRLVNAKSPDEIMALQAEFLRRQIEAFGEQAKDLGDTAAGAAAKTRR